MMIISQVLSADYRNATLSSAHLLQAELTPAYSQLLLLLLGFIWYLLQFLDVSAGWWWSYLNAYTQHWDGILSVTNEFLQASLLTYALLVLSGIHKADCGAKEFLSSVPTALTTKRMLLFLLLLSVFSCICFSFFFFFSADVDWIHFSLSGYQIFSLFNLRSIKCVSFISHSPRVMLIL